MNGRGRRLFLGLPLLGAALLTHARAQAILPDWDIDGSNTVRAEVYQSTGDSSASPYPEDGAQEYDEVHLGLSRRFNPWHRLRIDLDGLLNDSFYRSGEKGVVPERLHLSWERGDTGLPFRLEAGDTFGFFSYRILQRSLKGFQLDLQPRQEREGQRSSLLFLVGTNQRSWKDLQFNDDLTTGVSWVMEDSWGRLALNAVGNYRARDTVSGLPARRQWVESLAAEFPFTTGNWRGSIEGEFAWFAGDHNGINGNNGLDREDTGLYLQVRGRSLHDPFGYRLRFERNGQDFQPAGAVVTPDRRSYEAHGDWRFGWGATLRGRAQLFHDAMESGDPLKTTTFGLNYSGSLLGGWDPRLSGGIDLYWQDRSDRNDTTDTITRSLTASLSRPLAGGWNGDLSLNWVATEDDTGGGSTTIARTLDLGLSHALDLHGWRGTIRPGVSLIRNTGPGSFDQYAPTLALQLARGRHRLDANLNLARQKAGVLGGIDTDTAAFALRYGYRPTDQDEITADLDLFAREADPGRGSEAWRVGVAWRHRFSRPHLVASREGGAAGVAAAADRAALLTAIAPGTGLAVARERVREAGLGAPRRIGPLWIYEGRLLEEID
ncbi:MAG: TonB-dependent receptor, partial [Gammaproteobacteria bacterium]